MEYRSFGDEAAPKLIDDKVIEGYAIVFNKESRILFDAEKKRFFVEIIRPSAVTPELLQRSDIKAYTEHNKQRLLARSFNGVGSLELEIEPYGLKYRFVKPNTTEGDYVAEMIRRRDIFGSSFSYTADEKNGVVYTKRPDGVLLREVTLFTGLYDVAPVTDPAYFGTDVNVRSLAPYFEEEKEPDYKSIADEYRKKIDTQFLNKSKF